MKPGRRAKAEAVAAGEGAGVLAVAEEEVAEGVAGVAVEEGIATAGTEETAAGSILKPASSREESQARDRGAVTSSPVWFLWLSSLCCYAVADLSDSTFSTRPEV